MILILSAINVDQLKIDLAEKNLVNLIFFSDFSKFDPQKIVIFSREKKITCSFPLSMYDILFFCG